MAVAVAAEAVPKPIILGILHEVQLAVRVVADAAQTTNLQPAIPTQ
jgi:hypothetical protein